MSAVVKFEVSKKKNLTREQQELSRNKKKKHKQLRDARKTVVNWVGEDE